MGGKYFEKVSGSIAVSLKSVGSMNRLFQVSCGNQLLSETEDFGSEKPELSQLHYRVNHFEHSLSQEIQFDICCKNFS